jgi:glycosyltransferase involved in cell wall biosynthesis
VKNILWLVSWYPNRFDSSYGDFIQRQAQAVSKYAKVHVLYVHTDETRVIKNVEERISVNENLTEQIIYYPSNTKNIFSKIFSIRKYYSLSKKFIEQYINKNGVPDYVHVQVPVRAGTMALWMQRKFKTHYALTEHYGIYNSVVMDPWKERSFIYQNAVKKIIANAQPLICVSRILGEQMMEFVGAKKFISIPNVVDTSLFHFVPKKIQNEIFRFIHVSNMIPLKNVEGIIDAVKILSAERTDFELKIIGRTPETIFRYAEQSGLLNKQIFFSGEIPYSQVATEMNDADAFILFSRSESSSCVLQESLCCGVPVISTPVGIALETINNTNGVLTPIDDVKMLSEKMNEMMNTHSNFNREKISKEYSRQFSYDEIGRKIFDTYGF